jgi:sec-independent protein translocase protein TatA
MITIPHLLLFLAVVLLVFGTKKLRNMGGDLGGAIKGFKKAMHEEDKSLLNEKVSEQPAENTKAPAKSDQQ